MKLIRKIIVAISVLSLILPTCVQATEYDITPQRTKDRMVINVKADPSERFAFQVLKKDVAISQLETAQNPGTLVSYTGAFVTNSEGTADVGMILEDTDHYVLYLKSEKGGNVIDLPFYFMKKNQYNTLIGDLNTELLNADDDTFYTKLFYNDGDSVDHLKALDVDNDLISLFPGKERDISDIFFNACNGAWPNEAKTYFDAASAIIALNTNNDKTPANAMKYLSELLNTDTTFKGYATKHLKTEDAEKFFTSLLKGKNIASIDELIDESKKALILTAVKYPDGNMNIKSIFDTYKSVLGLSSVSSASSVYLAIGGKTYSKIGSITEQGTLLYDYTVAVNNAGNDGGGNGGSGDSGGGSGYAPNINISGGVPSQETNKTPIEMNFLDLDDPNVNYESVSRLFQLGIVSGYSDYEFKPNNTVKREEFIAMLVRAMGLENVSYTGGIFKDTAGTWCDKVVCIAYENGLTQGMGGGIFGMGYEITRQDMAVMVYNAMLKKGYVPQGTENNFADKSDFSDYSHTAAAELNNLGIIQGVGDNIYKPLDNATRLQSAIIIDRALQYLR